ncbi:hypothetical protein BV509_16525 [Rhodovulum sulfidophilum]|nr:hypothetical protein BV509_16525 [Rhodovulum sulfidophilum]
MRPVRLTLQAFGPFPGREVVDFRAAVAAGLFGIYGQTGSGKSTIFSAMTFALFGEAARAEQDAPSLRADHADPDMPTEVEFVFDLGERRYVLLRRPDQARPKTRGSGETRDPHEAYLFDATGLALDRIGPEGRGKVLAEKKVGAVAAAVTGLLGYGPEQFRQIVLLPQGRFETFLAARTRERLEILRELFDVSLYRRLAQAMKAEAEMLERTLREARAVCEGRLAAEGFDGMQALETGLAAAEARLAEARTAEAAAAREAVAARAGLGTAEQTEARFLAAAAADQALAGIREAAPAMAELAAQVRRADRARLLVDIEARVAEAARETQAAAARMDAAEARLELAEAAAKRAAVRAEAEAARAPETETLRREVETLARHAETQAAAAGLQRRAQEARALAEAARGELVAAQGALTQRMAQRGKAAEAVQAARQTSANRELLTARLQALEAEMKAARAVEAAQRDVADSTEAVARLAAAQEAAARRARAARDDLTGAERRLAQAQAVQLAAGLRPGAPCPVCGAIDHPAPAAAGAGDPSGPEAVLKAVRAAWDEADRVLREAERTLASERGVLADRQERLAGLDRPRTDAATLKDRIRATHEGLAALGAETEIAVAEGLLARLDAAVAAAEAARDRCRDAIAEREAVALREAARIEAMLAPVPQALRSEPALSAALGARKAALAAREAARASAVQAAADSREAVLAARAAHEAAVRAMAEARARHEAARQAFAGRLAETGLSAADLAELKPAIARLDEDRAAVEAHGRALAVAEERARATAEAIAGRDRPDLEALRAALEAAEARLSAATERRSGAGHARDHLAALRGDLAETLRRLEAEETASGPLRSLAALFDGRNPQGLDLETHAIGAMFDRVLAAANRRLVPMSAGRYRLERETEGGGRGRRGLGLQIFDLFTGKARPTATLSGGETFIAALALALGLADVVETASGKVRLDTIFIDEGFGSLDTENGAGTLDRVLQALGALVGRTRAVGLISHVPLVQEAIPNGFYVRKDPAGSRIETRGPV